MKQLFTFISFLLAISFQPAIACDPAADWRPPTVAEAYRNAIAVIHVKIISDTETPKSLHEGRIKLLHTYKGQFADQIITTGDSGMCGIGQFAVGKEYVFFFYTEKSFGDNKWYVTSLDQPQAYKVAHIIDEINGINR